MSIVTRGLSLSRPSSSLVRRFLTDVLRRRDLWRSRRALAALDPERLDDIGLSPADAAREARRGIWDAPRNWRD